jgi:carbon-monoxide dehydrogenase medium subunit
MKPPVFEYTAVHSIEEAVAELAKHGDGAKLLAGGQSLVPLLNMRLATPERLIDLNRVTELAHITPRAGGLAIGAMTRQRAVERSAVAAAHAPLLAAALPWVGHFQIRNRGTVGGSLSHADPAAELPAVALCLDVRFTARGPAGERTLEADEFFRTQLTTALAPTELLTEVWFPSTARAAGSAWLEIARRHGDYALVGVGAVVTLAGDRIGEARLALTGVGDRPLRARQAEARLAGESLTPGVLGDAAEAIRRSIDPGSDIHATAAYRRHVAGVLAGRAIRLAVARAKEATGV